MHRTKINPWAMWWSVLLTACVVGCGPSRPVVSTQVVSTPAVSIPDGFALNENMRNAVRDQGSNVHRVAVKIRSEGAARRLGRPIGTVAYIQGKKWIDRVLNDFGTSAHRSGRNEPVAANSDLEFKFSTNHAPFVFGVVFGSIPDDFGPSFTKDWPRLEADLKAAFAVIP